ncbi:MAG: substrate-binding domain-containing protein [Candidatus Thorarchaeota archaeon]
MVKLNAGFKTLILVVIIISSFTFLGLIYFSLNNTHPTITLATTTSTDNSGLLEYLHKQIEKDLDLKIEVIPKGTGAALEYARQGLADVVMVHARSLEDQFIDEGYGIHRVDLMYNDFVLVGPTQDPAQIKGLTNTTNVFQHLYDNKDKIKFFSRGDISGTNVKELELWKNIGINIQDNATWTLNNPWYLETGSGMGSTLTTTSTAQGYTLTDRATFLFMKGDLDLVILAEGSNLDNNWRNPYGIILVNPDKFETGAIKFDLAKEYVKWLISSTGQNTIDSYKIEGNQAFFADFMNLQSELPTEELQFWGIQ